MSDAPALGLGVIGAGAFAQFVLSAADDVAAVEVVAVTDADHDRAQRLAAAHRAPPGRRPSGDCWTTTGSTRS